MREKESLLYTKEHEWISRETDDLATVGITQYAQKELGEVVFVELPDPKRDLAAQEVFGSLESVKAVSDVYIPVSGTITEVNTALLEAPEKINEDPFGDGWLVRIQMADRSELTGLMDLKEYEQYISKED